MIFSSKMMPISAPTAIPDFPTPPPEQTVRFTSTTFMPRSQSLTAHLRQPQPLFKPAPKKNRTIALLLCLIFGVYGAHKFYEGKIGMGFLYFFTGGLFGIGWFVDLITLFLFRTNPYYV